MPTPANSRSWPPAMTRSVIVTAIRRENRPFRTKEQHRFSNGRGTSDNVLLLLSLAVAVGDAPAPTANAQAMVRVLRRTARASEADWKRAVPLHKSEILIKEKDGRTTRLRLVEYE